VILQRLERLVNLEARTSGVFENHRITGNVFENLLLIVKAFHRTMVKLEIFISFFLFMPGQNADNFTGDLSGGAPAMALQTFKVPTLWLWCRRSRCL
jgi:hypothetical protein